MAYTFTPPTTSAATVRALLAANRLEARPRSPEFNRALRAELRDPTWLLARQWQLREFQAEDRGSPAFVETAVQELPLSRLALPGQAPRTYNRQHQPLEAAVEAQPRVIGPGLRLQMGQYWLRQLRTLAALAPTTDPAAQATRTAAIGVFALAFPLTPPSATDAPVAYAQEASTAEVFALLELAGPAALDGYQLYQHLLAPQADVLTVRAALTDSDELDATLQAYAPKLAQDLLTNAPFAGPGTTLAVADAVAKLKDALGNTWTPLEALARQFVLTFHRLYLLGLTSSSWSPANLAYGFSLGVAAGIGLGAAHHSGGGALPWYAVDAQTAPAGTPAAPAVPVARRVLATEVQFPGAPAARWWEFEDRRVDVGRLSGDPSDWGRMLLQEFMFLYQRDWLTIPYSVALGTVCRVESLRVTDVFGLSYAIQPAGAGQLTEPDNGLLIDNDATRWQLFAQTTPGSNNPAPVPQLYVPAAVISPLVSQPAEQVSFRREEATNMVWAVESVISDGFAGGIDGTKAATQVVEMLRRQATPPAAGPATTAVPAYTYQLATAVPENWIPFVPITQSAGAVALEQGALERQVAGLALSAAEGFVQPRTALLQLLPATPYVVQEHELPPAGVRIDGQCYRARWHGGRILSWLGRRHAPAQLGGSSGLAFDQLRPAGS